VGNGASPESPTAHDRIALLARQAAAVARKARAHSKSLTGRNFYADKLAELRVDATNAFRELSERTVGDTSALAELIEACFSPWVMPQQRLEAERALTHELKTTWKERSRANLADGNQELFPLNLLVQAKHGYLVTIGRQMNGCYASGWYDASAVMMRRLLEVSIIEAFEGRGLAAKIKNQKGDFLQLSDLIGVSLAEISWNLSRNARTYLPKLRDIGHRSAHGRYFCAQKSDMDKVEQGCRVAVEEFLRLAGLL